MVPFIVLTQETNGRTPNRHDGGLFFERPPFYRFIEGLVADCPGAGCTTTEFCPTAPLTRAEAAILIAHAFDIWTLSTCDTRNAPAPSDEGAGTGGSAGSDAGTSSGGTGGTAPNASTGTGGTSGRGGSGGSTNPTGGSGGSAATAGTGGQAGAAAPSTSDDDGCGCRTPRKSPRGNAAIVIGLLALLLRRRMQSRAPQSSIT